MFLAVARRGTFRGAADELCIAQPWISEKIKTLEEELDTDLFRRDNSGATLTSAGVQFRRHAERIIREADNAERTMSAWRDAKGGLLRVGHSPVHREAAVAAVATVLREINGLSVTVEELLSPEIEAGVNGGDLDVGIIHAYEPPVGFVRKELGDATLRLVVHEKHRLAGNKAVAKLEELRGERFALTRSGLRSRQTVDAYFEAHAGFVPTIAVETNAMATVMGLVREWRAIVGVLPVPSPHLADRHGLLLGLALLDLPAPSQRQRTFLIWKGDGEEPDSEPLRTFSEALLKHLQPGPDAQP